ncbi:MAG: ATP phosphoribosyltransferase regulatory subunit [Gammaproteobacteria bacterium]|nr:ATP phosphoribosyltransferase regulatory subunit [Gammaproteobacteria bacterium]
MKRDRWLLPDGIEEMLPPAARHAERVRRTLLDLLDVWGYELIMPPLIEYLESLLTGVGEELDLKTFKLTDQLTGRMMGVRADMTPQAARVDAHYLRREEPVRLCYLGPVLRTRPDEFGGAREPLQIGAELFGQPGPRADAEVLRLMLAVLERSGCRDLHVDIGHVGVFHALTRAAGMDKNGEDELSQALHRKAKPEIDALLRGWALTEVERDSLRALADLHGPLEELPAAMTRLQAAGDTVRAALDDLAAVGQRLARMHPHVRWHFDLAELNGYSYYTGIVFAAYTPGYGQAVAQGGRYDEIGRAFGRSRPAVGFSADLRVLLRLQGHPDPAAKAIFAPLRDDDGLLATIRNLREQGERVIEALQGDPAEAGRMGCDRMLIEHNGQWTVTVIEGH